MMNGDSGYFYLNRRNAWPDFRPANLHQVEVAQNLSQVPDGSLCLSREADFSFKRRGVFCGGPFEVNGHPTPWFRLRVYADPLPDGAHLQLFTFTGESVEALYNSDAIEPFPAPGWHAAPRDVLDLLILNSPASRLWVGGVMWSTGSETPILHQMRVDYGRDTYLDYLPAIFREDDGQQDLLERLLALCQSELGGLEEVIDGLPRLFDPWAAPDSRFPSWLSWLAGWLAFDLNEAWSEAETRQFLAQAFHLYGLRGTVEGLRCYLKIYAGVNAHIVEPALHSHLWSLGEVSSLGFTTMLAPGPLGGAVLDTTAVLDRSHLSPEGRGAQLFEDVAHHFCVGVYCSELTRPGALEDVRLVIEREKPAHTTYDLCVIQPRLRVGVQARVGVDAIVAQGPPPAHVGMVLDLGSLAPAGDPANKWRRPVWQSKQSEIKSGC